MYYAGQQVRVKNPLGGEDVVTLTQDWDGGPLFGVLPSGQLLNDYGPTVYGPVGGVSSPEPVPMPVSLGLREKVSSPAPAVQPDYSAPPPAPVVTPVLDTFRDTTYDVKTPVSDMEEESAAFSGAGEIDEVDAVLLVLAAVR